VNNRFKLCVRSGGRGYAGTQRRRGGLWCGVRRARARSCVV